MDKEAGELVKFPVKLRKNISKPNPNRKSPQSNSENGYAFPQRLWEVYLDLSETRNDPYEEVPLDLPKHQLILITWFSLSSKNRKAGKPPLTDKEWFLLEDEYIMLIAKQAITNIVNRQLETDLLALKKGQHPILER